MGIIIFVPALTELRNRAIQFAIAKDLQAQVDWGHLGGLEINGHFAGLAEKWRSCKRARNISESGARYRQEFMIGYM
jgi:hypothetical protein